MNAVELVLVLVAASAALSLVAERVRIPYPIMLVVGGLALALIPGVPRLNLAPENVLVLFLPPLLFAAARLMSWTEFRAHARTIGSLAIGLVIATTAGVAVVAHTVIPGMPWGVAFVLGAIVSPPDAVAATTVLARMKVPRRIVTVLEGESLINDATGLVAYQVALAVAMGAGFSAWDASKQLVLVGLGGLALGLALAWLIARFHRFMDHAEVETAITLMTPYVAYIAAEHLGVSGVLAAVTAGGYLGWRSAELFSPRTRMRNRTVWSMVLFLLNNLVFILIGLELAGTHELLATIPTTRVVMWCAAVAGTTIAIRLVWVPIAVYLPRLLVPKIRRLENAPSGKEVAIVAWTAMRGIISVALVLALPANLPYRDVVVIVVFGVIVVTLVGQGLTLPLIVRAMRFVDDGEARQQERDALVKGAETALSRIDDVAKSEQSPGAAVDKARAIYTKRRDRFQATAETEPTADAEPEEAVALRRLRARLIEIERETYVDLRNTGDISEHVLQTLQRDLDLESLQPPR